MNARAPTASAPRSAAPARAVERRHPVADADAIEIGWAAAAEIRTPARRHPGEVLGTSLS